MGFAFLFVGSDKPHRFVRLSFTRSLSSTSRLIVILSQLQSFIAQLTQPATKSKDLEKSEVSMFMFKSNARISQWFRQPALRLFPHVTPASLEHHNAEEVPRLWKWK